MTGTSTLRFRGQQVDDVLIQDGTGPQSARAHGPPPLWSERRCFTLLHNGALLSLPAGGGQVYAPYDETRRGVAGNISAFGENTHGKRRLLRSHTQR